MDVEEMFMEGGNMDKEMLMQMMMQGRRGFDN
jgi:hypothetical protein